MAIDQPLQPNLVQTPLLEDDETETIVTLEDPPIPEDPTTQIETTADGGMLINFDPQAPRPVSTTFAENLAEVLEESDLSQIAQKLLDQFETDKLSRKQWEKTYEEGIDLLGLEIEERSEPWDGAAGVTHPILTEAVVEFQSQAIGEIFPEGGPVRTKLAGETTVQKTRQGQRVEHHMNWMVTEQMVEYREEMDRLLFALPVAGSAFKKTSFDPDRNRLLSTFIPAEDLVVNFGATSLKTATRVTEILRKDLNWIRKKQYAGFYRDVDLMEVDAESSALKDKLFETSGESKSLSENDLYTLVECHCDLDLPGFEDVRDGEETGIALPYVVTIDLGSNKVLSIYRNWLPDDPGKQKRQHYTHYQYIPGFGFYGLGLVHLLGGIAKGTTSMLRQLIDAGSLANLPAGYKTRGLRVKGERTPLAPGEFRDVDVPGGKISDNLMPLPYKEPSQVLLQLMNGLVEEGRRFSSSIDLKLGNMNQETPVGTTLALIERTMKNMTAIQARIHKALKDEFAIMVEILQGIPEKEYPYDVEGEEPSIMQQDFDQRIDVIPVSDPNSSTSSHRIMKAQTSLQMYSMAPHLFNAKPLFRNALEVMEIPGAKDIVPLESDLEPLDPISENMAILTQKPIKAFVHQDHEAHIQVHMLGMQDPKVQSILQESPQAQASAAAMMAHVTEHVAFQYRSEIERNLGTQLPPEGEPLPPEIEAEYSRLVAQAARKLFDRNTAEKQQVENEQLEEDPMMQIRKEELSIQRMREEGKLAIGTERLAIDRAKLAQKDDSESQDRVQEAVSNTERVVGNLLGEIVRAASETENLDSQERIKLIEMMMDRVNEEAKLIAAARENAQEN